MTQKAEYTKPIPLPDLETKDYWDGAKRHQRMVKHCKSCNKLHWPPKPICPHCLSFDTDWKAVSGNGTVYTFVVFHHPFSPAFAQEMPYAVVQVALDEQKDIHLMGNLRDCPVDQVRVGMKVKTVFEDVTPEITIPQFSA